MDTIEMDRMQAQIGELTVEMSRLRQEVAEKGSSNYKEVYTGTLDGLGLQLAGWIDNKYDVFSKFSDRVGHFKIDVQKGNIMVQLDIEMGGLGENFLYINPLNYPSYVSEPYIGCISFSRAFIKSGDGYNAQNIVLCYTNTSPGAFILTEFNSLQNDVITSYLAGASSVNYTLTLYFHEMPEE